MLKTDAFAWNQRARLSNCKLLSFSGALDLFPALSIKQHHFIYMTFFLLLLALPTPNSLLVYMVAGLKFSLKSMPSEWDEMTWHRNLSLSSTKCMITSWFLATIEKCSNLRHPGKGQPVRRWPDLVTVCLGSTGSDMDWEIITLFHKTWWEPTLVVRQSCPTKAKEHLFLFTYLS